MNIPEIPPFNPNARRRREEGQGHHNKLPGPQEPQRPATTTVLPLTPHNTNARSQQQAASQTTGSKTTHRNSAAPTSSSHAAPEGAHSSSSSRHHQPGHTSSRYRVCFGPYTLLQTLGEGEFGKVKLGVRGDTCAWLLVFLF